MPTRDVSVYHLLGHDRVLLSQEAAAKLSEALGVMTLHEIIRRPLVTEKGVAKKDNERTLCFEVAPHANKTQVKAAVEKLFKVKVDEVRTAQFRRQSCGAAAGSPGIRPDWKKAYVKLKAGEKVPDLAEI